MASRRNLKKDINYLTGELIADCFSYMCIHPDKNREKTIDLIEDTAVLRNELVTKVNKAKKEKDPKKVKQMFVQIKSEMFSNIDKSFENLSKIIK